MEGYDFLNKYVYLLLSIYFVIYRQLYMYQYMLLEFVSLFGKHKNASIRKKLKCAILKTNFNKNINNFNKNIENLVDDSSDVKKINTMIFDYLQSNDRNKNMILDQIDMTRFKFDSGSMNKLKNLPHKELVSKLKTLSKKIITIGSPNWKNSKFNNSMISCASIPKNETINRCKNKKLIIPRDKFNKYIEILASDILNPLKSNWIFSGIYETKIISYFKFIRRQHEYINIEIS